MPKKQRFQSGATRSEALANTNRVALGFIQMIGDRGTLGEEKHGRFNYRRGLTDPAFVENAFVHGIAHLQRLANEYHNTGKFPVGGDDDLAGAAWSTMFLWEAREAQRASTNPVRNRRRVR